MALLHHIVSLWTFHHTLVNRFYNVDGIILSTSPPFSSKFPVLKAVDDNQDSWAFLVAAYYMCICLIIMSDISDSCHRRTWPTQVVFILLSCLSSNLVYFHYPFKEWNLLFRIQWQIRGHSSGLNDEWHYRAIAWNILPCYCENWARDSQGPRKSSTNSGWVHMRTNHVPKDETWLGSWFELRSFTCIANAFPITIRICALRGDILLLLCSPRGLTHAWLQRAFPKCTRMNHVPKELCVHMSYM